MDSKQTKSSSFNIDKIIWSVFLYTVFAYIITLYIEATKNGWAIGFSDKDIFDLNNPLQLPFMTTGFICLSIVYALPKLASKLFHNPRLVLITRLILCEMCLLFGFSLAFASKNLSIAFPFFIGSFIGIILLYPSNKKSSNRSERIGIT